MSLGRPTIEWLTGRIERIVIILDTSPTMATRNTAGQTRWQQAVSEALAILETGGPTTEFHISDTSGITATPFSTDRAAARDTIERMSPRAVEVRFPKVDPENTQVYFISDGVALPEVPEYAKRISVFEPAPNAGITAFEVRPMPSTPLGYEAFLEVQNYGTEPTQVDLTLSSSGPQRILRSLRLDRGEAFRESFDLSRFDGGAVQAEIRARNDALRLDDRAFAYLPVKRKTRTLLVTRGNRYLETVLKLDTYVDLTVTTPPNFRENANVDVYVFDRFAPPAAPSKPALVIGTPDAPWLRRGQGVVEKPGITAWAEDSPLMQFVSVHDVSIERATRIDPAGLTVVAQSNQTPLIVVSDKPKWVMLTFALESSDFPLHAGFPIFIENVLSWLGREPLALRRAPGEIEVPLSGAEIRDHSGKVIASRPQGNLTTFNATEAGLFVAVAGDNRVPVAVNLANRRFSDVNRSGFEEDAPAFTGTRFLRRELWFYMLLAAIALISLEWFTYHRRITL
jgi:hypothetical protein